MFLTEDGGFPLMVSLGYGVPLRTKLYLGRLRPKGEQGTILISVNDVRKGVRFLQKMFNKKCKEQNLAAERCMVKQRLNG